MSCISVEFSLLNLQLPFNITNFISNCNTMNIWWKFVLHVQLRRKSLDVGRELFLLPFCVKLEALIYSTYSENLLIAIRSLYFRVTFFIVKLRFSGRSLTNEVRSIRPLPSPTSYLTGSDGTFTLHQFRVT